MKTSALTISVFLSSLSGTLASYALQPATIHKSRPDSCFNKETSSFYEDGDSWQLKGCGMASCMKIRQPSGKSQMMISFEGCGSVGYEPPCYIQENKGAEFPDCCPEVVCPDSSEQDSYYSGEDELINELGTEANKTETKPERIAKETPEFIGDYYDESSLISRERHWRQVYKKNGMDLQQLNSEEDDEDVIPQKPTRKMSPRFFYWY